jgi:hypothetical protein
MTEWKKRQRRLRVSRRMQELLAGLGREPWARDVVLANHAAEVAEQLREIEKLFAKRETSPEEYSVYVRMSGQLRRLLRELGSCSRVAA